MTLSCPFFDHRRGQPCHLCCSEAAGGSEEGLREARVRRERVKGFRLGDLENILSIQWPPGVTFPEHLQGGGPSCDMSARHATSNLEIASSIGSCKRIKGRDNGAALFHGKGLDRGGSPHSSLLTCAWELGFFPSTAWSRCFPMLHRMQVRDGSSPTPG